MGDILIDFGIKLLGYIFPFAAGWLYKKEKFDKNIKVRVRGEGDGVVYICGELPKVQIWLTVTNFTPFKIDVDRIYGSLFYGCSLAEILLIRRHVIEAAQEKTILVEVLLNEHQVSHLRKNLNQYETRLSLSAYIVSKVHKTEINRGEINTNNVRLINF